MNFKLPNVSVETLCCVRTEDDVKKILVSWNYFVASWGEYLNYAW
jgi:hypothetical protein